MKTASAACIVVAVMSLFGPRASAAPMHVSLSVPLFVEFAGSSTPDATLSGILSYDDDTLDGSGTFTIGGFTDRFVGIALADASGPGLSVEFFGDNAGGDAHLSFNLDLDPATGAPMRSSDPGSVMLSATGGSFAFTTVPSAIDGGTGPGGALPSPVPLPPTAALLGGALMLLSTLRGPRRTARPLRANAAP